MDTLLKPVVALLDRFRFRAKFLIIMVMFLIPMVVFAYLLSSELRQTIATAELEDQGVKYIQPLRQLVEHVAQHRGMTNALLNGDSSFGPKINAKAAQVNGDFKLLKTLDERLGKILGTDGEVVRLQGSWQRLATGARSMSTGESFSAHSALVAEVINFTKVIADRARLSSDPKPGTHALTLALVEYIPVAVENMGQTRGAGVGVIAARQLSAEKKLKLSILTDRINVAAKNLKKSFEYAFDVSPALEAHIGDIVEQALKATERFQHATKREILNAGEITISAGDYFGLGTKAIGANLALYDEVLPLLDELLVARAEEARDKELASAALFAAMVVGLLYIFAGLYRTLQRGIEQLLGVANHLSEGDLTHRLEPKSKDEMAEIAFAINRIAEDMGQSVRSITVSGDHLEKLGGRLLAASKQTQTGVARQVGEINHAATAINEMSATVQEVAASTNRTAQEADRAMHAAETGQQVVGQAIDSINTLAGEVEQTTKVIGRLEENTSSISSILETIRGIADQTNLLALNAAIEAARAGDQGRGFAVVADEVRTLAQRTQDSTLEIQGMIERLQQGTTEAVTVMVRSGECAKGSVAQAAGAGKALREITATVATIHEMTTQIATAVEEQSVVAEEINRNINNVNTVAEQTAADADDSTEAGNQVAALASEVRALLDRFRIDGAALAQVENSQEKLMVWDDSLSIGIAEIDRQHKRLVTMLNELHQVLTSGRGLHAVQRILNGLANYTVTHFSYEEQLMQKHNYPDFDEHKRKHEALVGEVLAFKERIDAGDGSIGGELLEFVKQWLVGHIHGSDKEYAPFINANGAR